MKNKPSHLHHQFHSVVVGRSTDNETDEKTNEEQAVPSPFPVSGAVVRRSTNHETDEKTNEDEMFSSPDSSAATGRSIDDKTGERTDKEHTVPCSARGKSSDTEKEE